MVHVKLRLNVRRLVLGLEHKAWGPVLAAHVAYDVLPAHGAACNLFFFVEGSREVGRGVGGTNRRILRDLCCDTSGGSNRRCDFVPHDARGGRLFGEGACSAGEEQLVLGLVFAGEKEVRAVRVSFRRPKQGLRSARLTSRGRNGRESACSGPACLCFRSLLAGTTWRRGLQRVVCRGRCAEGGLAEARCGVAQGSCAMCNVQCVELLRAKEWVVVAECGWRVVSSQS